MSEPDREALPRTGTLMQGKRGVVMGVANERSLAWGIAAACAAQGASLAFTYQGEALGRRVRPLAESLGAPLVVPCDVGSDESIDTTFREIAKNWDGLDFLVHAIGWADKAYLRGSTWRRRVRRSSRRSTSRATRSPRSAGERCR